MPGRILEEAAVGPSPPAETKKPLYTVVDIPNKGRGIIAASPIKKGTLIFSEKPLLTIDHEPSTDYDKTQAEMLDKVADLPQEAQDQIFSLHNAHATTLPELAGIMQTNGFTLDDAGVALFSEACFMNHSCRPTVEAGWNAVKGEMNIHASQDMEVGDECACPEPSGKVEQANSFVGSHTTTCTLSKRTRSARASSSSSMVLIAAA